MAVFALLLPLALLVVDALSGPCPKCGRSIHRSHVECYFTVCTWIAALWLCWCCRGLVKRNSSMRDRIEKLEEKIASLEGQDD